MANTCKEFMKIVKTQQIASDVYSMWVESKELVSHAKPGQFVSVYSKDGSKLLPRPISICELDQSNHLFRLVYRVVGKGTLEFSSMKAGESIEIMGPLGNGYTLEGESPLLIGGGIGIPPMLELAKEWKQAGITSKIVLGYRGERFLEDELSKYGEVYIATEDGSMGTKGNVIDAIKEHNLTGDVIYSCGPTPMLRGVKAFAQEHRIKAYLSLEEKMACGIGACLACVCKSKEVDSHSHVNNKRVCKDGPVFLAEEVEL